MDSLPHGLLQDPSGPLLVRWQCVLLLWWTRQVRLPHTWPHASPFSLALPLCWCALLPPPGHPTYDPSYKHTAPAVTGSRQGGAAAEPGAAAVGAAGGLPGQPQVHPGLAALAALRVPPAVSHACVVHPGERQSLLVGALCNLIQECLSKEMGGWGACGVARGPVALTLALLPPATMCLQVCI